MCSAGQVLKISVQKKEYGRSRGSPTGKNGLPLAAVLFVLDHLESLVSRSCLL